jgi:hypothetical protein
LKFFIRIKDVKKFNKNINIKRLKSPNKGIIIIEERTAPIPEKSKSTPFIFPAENSFSLKSFTAAGNCIPLKTLK